MILWPLSVALRMAWSFDLSIWWEMMSKTESLTRTYRWDA